MITMDQTRLVTRVQTTIQIIRRQLTQIEECEAFNDLLIIGRIVPKLPAETLLQLLLLLKPLPDLIHKTPQAVINLSPLFPILA